MSEIQVLSEKHIFLIMERETAIDIQNDLMLALNVSEKAGHNVNRLRALQRAISKGL
jgi:hypothetical protein